MADCIHLAEFAMSKQDGYLKSRLFNHERLDRTVVDVVEENNTSVLLSTLIPDYLELNFDVS